MCDAFALSSLCVSMWYFAEIRENAQGTASPQTSLYWNWCVEMFLLLAVYATNVSCSLSTAHNL